MEEKKSEIDRAQADTVEDHFEAILASKGCIDSDASKIRIDHLPAWFDAELFKRGQDYYSKNVLAVVTAYSVGLIAVFLVPTIAKVLTFTNQSSTPCAAFRRYFQTLLHIHYMHRCDVLDPKSKFYKSLNTIRWKHSTTSARLLSRKDQGITHRDMVLTQFGFVGYVLLSPGELSLTDGRDDRQAFNHFWRVVGHLLGIPDELNLCRGNEKETTRLCRRVRDDVYKKCLRAPEPSFLLLTKAALDGLRSIDPMVDVDAFLTLFYTLNNDKYTKSLGLWSWINVLYRNITFYLIGLPLVGTIVRSFWNYYLLTLYWFNEKYPLVARWRFGKENSKIKLYPHSSF
ncbi:uncharacterized protein LOC106658171 [Trichogramma pretiosum]|uniref:uncharacterized protein LOC106658171 n=1 Tax=Trichogramma pretiosum TaxID=7493 RepID=UPI000C71973E|nr:uncharacterized protein LOC106658171 [Trichogramma pretiosum]